MGLFELFSAALSGFYSLIPNYGLAIILLTLAVRTLLLPLSIKQTKSMRETQRIQPEIKKLQAKYKGDRQKLNEEMMALYKEHGVNPFGGCLPMVLQLPVMIGLFYVIRSPLRYLGFMIPEKDGEPIAAVLPPSEWVLQDRTGIMETLQNSRLAEALHDHALTVNQWLGIRLDCAASNALNNQDPILLGESCGGGVVSALPYLILILLMGLTTWYQQRQMQASSTASGPQAQQQQLMAKILPIMLVVFAFGFPSGVVLYWITTNLWTIGQQAVMMRLAPPLPVPSSTSPGKMSKAALKPDAGKPPKKGTGRPETESSSSTPSQRSPSAKKKKR